jgi:aminoglycoside 2''-phosphotransferase
MTPSSGLVAALRRALPTLAIRGVRLAGAGDFCRAYWVSDGWIVRVPKHAQASGALQREAAVLPGLARALEMAIPVPEHVGTDARTGFTVVAHRALRGVALTRARLRRLTPAVRTALADQIGRFFHQLHTFPLSLLPVSVPAVDPLAAYRSRRQAIEARVFPRLPPACARRCLQLLEDFEPSQRRALLHGDLYEQHILLDPRKKSVAGVIDFGDLATGDPDADLRTVLDDLGPAFLRAVLRAEPRERALRRFERARVYCVWDALTWNLEQIELRRRAGVSESLRAIAALTNLRSPLIQGRSRATGGR